MKLCSLLFAFVCSLLCLLSSCTYSISMVHTEGEASDVIDQNQAANPNISPDISVPISGLGK